MKPIPEREFLPPPHRVVTELERVLAMVKRAVR